MAKIAYILLCHKNAKAIIDQAEQLTAAGDYLSIHFDASASAQEYRAIHTALVNNPNVAFVQKRLKCGWGEWSLVQATLNAVETAVRAFPRATHFYMLSGDCMSVKSADYAHDFLDRHDFDFCESFDFFESDWIKTGIKEDRLIYRHFFNERTHKKLFDWNLWLQRRLGWTRNPPKDLQIMIGSQWWCLRRQTVESILRFCRNRPDVLRFFRTTWIPDETFFQTLVRHLVPRNQIQTRTLTFLMFTDYGMPVTFHNDHYDMLLGQDNLFARKISVEADGLREKLGALYNSGRTDFQISDEGRNLFKFLTTRGRTGRRFADRFWENESRLGRNREVLIIACKKWHVAKRLVEAAREHTDLQLYDYIFDEASAALPDLGGIENSMSKRNRHRRSLVRMLVEHDQTNRLVFCVDPSRIDLIADFYADRSRTRLLYISCDLSEEFLRGHAKRVGLASDQTSEDGLSALVRSVRKDIHFEGDEIHDRDFENTSVLQEFGDRERQEQELAQFFMVDNETAGKLLDAPYLFSD